MRFCDIQYNQGRGRGYQPKPKAEAYNPYQDLGYPGYQSQKRNLTIGLFYIERNRKKYFFCFCTDGKQGQARKRNMITFRNHAPRSYMT